MDPGTLLVAAEAVALLALAAALAVVWRLVRRDRGRGASRERADADPEG